LQVKVEKQKKRPDSEGGGFVTPAGRGKIIGGKKKGGEDEGKFGAMSEVIVLRGMLYGMDLEAELSGEGGGLMQEIGEECSEKVFSTLMRQSIPILILCAVRKCRTGIHRPRCW
jgi:splicing factor 45